MKKIKKSSFLIYGSISLFFASVVWNKVQYNYDWENAFWRTYLAPITGTVWATGFTEENFKKVKPGMSSSVVRKLVGHPLNESCGSWGCSWMYSREEPDVPETDRRWVRFDLSDKVDKIWHEFHID
jgi:hypothetical protein